MQAINLPALSCEYQLARTYSGQKFCGRIYLTSIRYDVVRQVMTMPAIKKSNPIQGAYTPIIMIIWQKMAQFGLEESSDVEGFRWPKYTQIKAETCI